MNAKEKQKLKIIIEDHIESWAIRDNYTKQGSKERAHTDGFKQGVESIRKYCDAAFKLYPKKKTPARRKRRKKT